ncbi:S24 family peptidase [Pedobacter nyackensis]|uniref:Phage repressor protein C, contains Cro/C1-type HTH and peptisase s24 domains n=1 Tax=Pedobacter nyackensis TaxID=475255 RepID=A0A1W1ZWD6_9SPHI|nr:hypothetical protein [Pedobacter nyackensis]SMC52378.1 Phage repressor protein C, contains Cro/C1-type HTH and peptisase s24 domains [Pedobacter nyackensis]
MTDNQDNKNSEKFVRLMEVMAYFAFANNSEFAKTIKTSKSYISEILKSQVPPKTMGQKLEDNLNVSRQWYETGEGEMLLSNKVQINQSQNNAKPLHEVHYPINPADAPFIDMGNGQYTMLIPLVDEYSYASFPGGFKDPEYVSELRKISITVDKQHSGRYFAFEILGDSMENYSDKESAKKSIADGSTVVGREIQKHHWKSRLHYHKWATFVIVHKEYGITCKTILDQEVADGIIHLGSFNPDKSRHKDFAWNLDDIQAIFNIVRIINEP